MHNLFFCFIKLPLPWPTSLFFFPSNFPTEGADCWEEGIQKWREEAVLGSYICKPVLVRSTLWPECCQVHWKQSRWESLEYYRRTALRKEGRHLPFTPYYWFSLEWAQALPGQWILLLPRNYLVLKQGRFCLPGALDHFRNDCKSRVLPGKKGVSVSSLYRQSRRRTRRQPSCSEAQKSTILGYTWKWSGSPT